MLIQRIILWWSLAAVSPGEETGVSVVGLSLLGIWVKIFYPIILELATQPPPGCVSRWGGPCTGLHGRAVSPMHVWLGPPGLLEALPAGPFLSLSLTPFMSQPWTQFLSLAASC